MAIFPSQWIGTISNITKLVNDEPTNPTLFQLKVRPVKRLTWNSKPPRYSHTVLPYQLLYTSACPHQQLIELQSPRTRKVHHKDQDQPETPTTHKDYEYWLILKMLIKTRLTLNSIISQQVS
jgi:hypothetical protein